MYSAHTTTTSGMGGVGKTMSAAALCRDAAMMPMRRAIKGLVLMSADLEAMGRSVALGRVPLVWSSVAYPSLKPLAAWSRDLIQRWQQLLASLETMLS